MREIIQATQPSHGIVGEEHGAERPDADYVWVLDPLDGTKAFITGKPLFGTLIALAHRGRPILGIIDAAALQERWVGALGQPTSFNGAPVRTRACPSLDRAMLNSTTPDMFKGADAEAFDRVRGRARGANYGGDCYAYGLVASGFIDLVIEAGLKPHDYMAVVPVIEGAGGVITDWQGGGLHLGSDGRMVAAGDARAHGEALLALAGNFGDTILNSP